MYNYPNYIRNNITFLYQLSKAKSDTNRKRLLDKATPDQIFAISEIIYNILEGNFPLHTRVRRRLGKNVQFYKKVSRSRSEKTTRKNIQKGGQLGALSALLLPFVSALAQHVLDKTISKR